MSTDAPEVCSTSGASVQGMQYNEVLQWKLIFALDVYKLMLSSFYYGVAGSGDRQTLKFN